jgi:hypothetical protein
MMKLALIKKPGIHSVEGHWRGDTWVDPNYRSNPDGNPYNNLNP